MPCQMEPYWESSSHDSKYQELKAEADKLTRMLCALCKRQLEPLPTKELQDWWKNHQEVDRKREAKEKAEKEARLNVLLEKKKKLEEEIKELKNA